MLVNVATFGYATDTPNAIYSLTEVGREADLYLNPISEHLAMTDQSGSAHLVFGVRLGLSREECNVTHSVQLTILHESGDVMFSETRSGSAIKLPSEDYGVLTVTFSLSACTGWGGNKEARLLVNGALLKSVRLRSMTYR